MAPVRQTTSKLPASRTRSYSSGIKSKTIHPSFATSPHRRSKSASQEARLQRTTTSSSFPTLASYHAAEAEYLASLSARKRHKALIDLPLFQTIWNVLTSPEDTLDSPSCTPQFKFWVKKMFSIRPAPTDVPRPSSSSNPDPVQLLLFHNDRPVAVRGQLYEILCSAHEASNHGGRDRTDALVRSLYSYVPKDLVNRFVSICPTCRRKKASNSRYRYLPWAIAEVDLEIAGNEEIAETSEEYSEDDSANATITASEYEQSSFEPGPEVYLRREAVPVQPLQSTGSSIDTSLLPEITGWDGPTTTVSDDQLHLPEVAESVIHARSGFYLSNSAPEPYRYGFDWKSCAISGELSEHVNFPTPPRSTSPIHLRPFLYTNFQEQEPGMSNQTVAPSEGVNLPSLHHVIPQGFRTGLGIGMQGFTSSDAYVAAKPIQLETRTPVCGSLPSVSEEDYHRKDSCWISIPTDYALSPMNELNESHIDPVLLGQSTGMYSVRTEDTNPDYGCRPTNTPVAHVLESEYDLRLSSDRRVVAREITNSAPQSPKARDKIVPRSGATNPAITPPPSSSHATRWSIPKESAFNVENGST